MLAELYDALGQLRYPEIAKIELKDLSTNVLTGQNRINLLAWLLSRASSTLSAHLEKFQGSSLKDEVVKCYVQMGISIDENTLLGNCSVKQQIPTLKALLLFTRSLDSVETVQIDDLTIYEILDKHIKESLNIIPPTCHVSMKLTESEAKKYLQEIMTRGKEVIGESPVSEPLKPEALTVEDKIDLESKTEIENGQIVSLDSVMEAFSAAFESAEFWRNSKSSDLAPSDEINIDETIQSLYKDLSSVAQVFESKKAILATKAPKCIDKTETPLSLLIEDNVIFSEEIRSLYGQSDLEN